MGENLAVALPRTRYARSGDFNTVGSEIEFDDRGAHELKGVPGEWRLYAARA
jgi:hypothetical protein